MDEGIDNDGNGYIDDIWGWNFCSDNNVMYSEKNLSNHGNNIVGILVGSNYHKQCVGMLRDTGCEVMCLPAVEQYSDIKNIVEAIEYAEKNNADICCLALKTYIDSVELRNVISKSDMLFVVAAGNDGAKLGSEIMVYPAMYEYNNVITVADIRCDGRKSYMSNYSDIYVDVALPGTDIVCISDKECCEYSSGTSLATSIMAGICALVRNNSQELLDAPELRKYICSNSKNKKIEKNEFVPIPDLFELLPY